MAFTATRTAQGQYFLYNDKTGEHVTVDTAEDVTAAIDAYNQATIDKEAAAKAAAEAEAGPVAVPVIDVMPSGSAVGPVAVPEAAAAPAPGPVTNAN